MLILNLTIIIIEVLLIKFLLVLSWPLSIVLGILFGFVTTWFFKEFDFDTD